jgi:hypothetical protein
MRAAPALLAVLALGLAACGEKEQVVFYKQGKYQGKPDTPAWGDGERAAWEAQIRTRQLTQHEHKRIYQ